MTPRAIPELVLAYPKSSQHHNDYALALTHEFGPFGAYGYHESGDFFSDVGHAVSSVASTVSHVASDVSHGISDATHMLIHAIPGGEAIVHDIQSVANQVKGLTHTLASLAGTIPVVGQVVDAASHFVDAVASGDVGQLGTAIAGIARDVSDIVGFVPGIGSGLATAMNAALTVLQGGGAISAILEVLLSNIPLVALPEVVKDVFRTVASMIDQLLSGKSFTDIAISKIKSFLLSRVPDFLKDLANQGLNALISLVSSQHPIIPAAGKIASHVLKGHQAIKGYPAPAFAVKAAQQVQASAKKLALRVPAKPPKHILMKLPPLRKVTPPQPTVLAASTASPTILTAATAGGTIPLPPLTPTATAVTQATPISATQTAVMGHLFSPWFGADARY